MSLTNRILLAMVLGISLGSVLGGLGITQRRQWALRIFVQRHGDGSVRCARSDFYCVT